MFLNSQQQRRATRNHSNFRSQNVNKVPFQPPQQMNQRLQRQISMSKFVRQRTPSRKSIKRISMPVKNPLQQQLDEYKRDIKVTIQMSQQIKKEKDSYALKCEKLTAVNNELQKIVEEKNQIILKIQNLKEDNLNNCLQQEIKDNQDLVTRLQKALQDLQAQKSLYESENIALKLAKDQLLGQIEKTSQSSQQNLDNSLEKMKNEVSELSNELVDVRKQLLMSNEELRILKNQENHSQQEQELNSQLEQQKSPNSILIEEDQGVQHILKKQQELLKVNEEMDKDVKNLKVMYDDVLKHNSELEKKYEKACKTIENLDDQLLAEQNKFQQKDEQLIKKNHEIIEKTQQILNLQEKLQAHQQTQQKQQQHVYEQYQDLNQQKSRLLKQSRLLKSNEKIDFDNIPAFRNIKVDENIKVKEQAKLLAKATNQILQGIMRKSQINQQSDVYKSLQNSAQRLGYMYNDQESTNKENFQHAGYKVQGFQTQVPNPNYQYQQYQY